MTEQSGLMLRRLLERHSGSMMEGSCLNCEAHLSGQVVDLTALATPPNVDPSDVLERFLTGGRRVEIAGFESAAQDRPGSAAPARDERGSSPAVAAQARLLARLRDLAEDARDYEETTGENALFVGFPFVSLPPGVLGLSQAGGSSRVLAPLALVAVDLEVRRGAVQSVTLAAKAGRADFILPNLPLLAWLEQETGRETSDLFADNDSSQAWRQVNEIARFVAARLSLDQPDSFGPRAALAALPRVEDLPGRPAFINAAVLGLFPVSGPGLLRDLKAMAAGRAVAGTVGLFLSAAAKAVGAGSAGSPGSSGEVGVLKPRGQRRDRFVVPADPCQAKAVRLAAEHRVLVIDSPPGTGKSQTLTNIIADHLARGERVLMVSAQRATREAVKHRLAEVGLGDLCAVVEDPLCDQDALLKRIRAGLEALPQMTLRPEADRELEEVDGELRKVQSELRGYAAALSELPVPGGRSFHDLVGEWLSLGTTLVVEPDQLNGVDLDQLSSSELSIVEILDRSRRIQYPRNPWVHAAALDLGEFLAGSTASLRERLQQLRTEAVALDAPHDPALPPLTPAIPPLTPDDPLPAQAEARQQLAALLRELEQAGPAQARTVCFDQSPETTRQLLSRLTELEPQLALIQRMPLDPELARAGGTRLPSLPDLDRSVAVLQNYGVVGGRWYAFLFPKRKASARKVLAAYGLGLSPDQSSRVRSFLEGLKARLVSQDYLVRELGGSASSDALLPDAELSGAIRQRGALLDTVARLRQNAALPCVRSQVVEALGGSLSQLADRLEASAGRARRVHDFLVGLAGSGLFAAEWRNALDGRLRNNHGAGPELGELLETFGTLEDVLWVRREEALLPPALRGVIAAFMGQGTGGSEAVAALRKVLLGEEITRRLRATPLLQELDPDRMEVLLRRSRQLQDQQSRLCAEQIRNLWVEVQKVRLLGNRSQLNHAGINFKRRLLPRGQRALKLRQVILQGSRGQESDPLFDMCPVWMASPAAIAQLLPRQADFDILLFAEASQCRLEDAIPVLSRGQRVVVFGDPQQLPPARFFEPVMTSPESGDTDPAGARVAEPEVEAETLFTAALSVPIPRCCLEVHYRSQDQTLIAFSNRHFYKHRLQPIPAHPSRRLSAPAIRLIRADGICDQGVNLREADWVVRIVGELLQKPDPPSIGVACFSRDQRGLILDRLEEAAKADPGLAERYAQARRRRSREVWEGLFVRTLENLQGAERDHIIVSTTFGPDAEGKWQGCLGPVSQPWGARHLNVLVTGARQMIHLLTSIPRVEYAVLPDLVPGEVVGGGWLLWAYLHDAEKLQEEFGVEPCPVAPGPGSPLGRVKVNPHRGGSPVALALARRLAGDHGQNCEVSWGNDGFSVDVVLRDPSRPGEVALGLLCDLGRFRGAEDPLEWDLFRTATLEAQGWNLCRVWSPALFRDPLRIETDLCQKAAGDCAPRDPVS